MNDTSKSPVKAAFDVEAIRRDFPILARSVNDRPLVYLDSAASSQKPLAVLEAERQYYRTSHANIHRGVYVLSEEATAAYEHAHEQVADFIHADWDEVIFTKNTTESLNLLAYAWGLSTLQSGDEIVTTVLEHHSNIVALAADRPPYGGDGALYRCRFPGTSRYGTGCGADWAAR